MRVGRGRQRASESAIDLTPLLDTVFILVFIFVIFIVCLSVTKVKAANESAASSEAQLAEMEENNVGLAEEIGALREDIGGLQDEIMKKDLAIADYELENLALQDELDKLMDESENFLKEEHLKGYNEISQAAIIICVRLERNGRQRTVQVLIDDEPVDKEISFEDNRLIWATDQIYMIVDKCLKERIGQEEIEIPKFVYLSRIENMVYYTDVDEITKKLEGLKEQYKNLYVVQ